LFPRSIYTPQYLGVAKLIPSIDAYYEPWTVLGHIAARNRLGRLRLGTAVTDASQRNPAVTAQAAATLHLLSRGRAILGIGTGERAGNEPYGVDWTKPVARFEEALATIRALWNSRGELVNRDSPFFPLRNAVFDLPPYRGKWPEIWVGAHGPRMLRATGRYADAWFPDLAFHPADYQRGLASSGRSSTIQSPTPSIFSGLKSRAWSAKPRKRRGVTARSLIPCRNRPPERPGRRTRQHQPSFYFPDLQEPQ